MREKNGNAPALPVYVRPNRQEIRQAQETGRDILDVQLQNVERDSSLWFARKLEAIENAATRQRQKWEARENLARNTLASIAVHYRGFSQ